MNAEDLLFAKKLMLKILEDVHQVCVENGIKYFLHFGSLIGAVRHNGFIPWDDDIDIGMLRPDYERFCKIAPKKLGKDYVLQSFKTDKGYGLYFSKVMLLGTLWQEQNSLKTSKKYNGLCIDVFPFDKIPSSLNEEERQVYFSHCSRSNVFTLYKFKYRNQDENDSFIKKAIINLLPRSFFIWNRKKVFSRYRKLKEDYLITGLWNNTVRHPLPETYYNELILHKFEDKEFYIPKYYHEILTAFFGDYMKLPPESERPTHKIVSYDFGKYGEKKN